MSPFDKIALAERVEILGLFARPKRGDPVPVVATLTRFNVVILRLRYGRDLSFKDIATATGESEHGVTRAHHRSLESLRNELAYRGITKKAYI
jgi:hypothetical protein